MTGVSHAFVPMASAALEEVTAGTEVKLHCADGHFIENGEAKYSIQCEGAPDGKTSQWNSVVNQCVSDGTLLLRYRTCYLSGCPTAVTSCPPGDILVNVVYMHYGYKATVTPVASFDWNDQWQYDCLCTNVSLYRQIGKAYSH